MSLLRVSGVNKQAENGVVLKDIHFSQQALQKIAIAGETGSGKSTLLKIIAGLAQADSGEVWLEEKRVLGLEEKLMPGHKQIAYLSQHFELPNFYTVDNILTYENRLPEEAAEKLYRLCQIEHLLKRDTAQLSGGEKQRIALARALIRAPKLLLLDEPFSNLDMGHKTILKRVIQDIAEQMQVTCILVSHDPLDTLSWADHILVMKDGEIIQQGTPQQVYQQPINEYIGALFGQYNLLPVPTFPDIVPMSPGGKKLFVRPEQITLTKMGSKGLKGQVQSVRFFGSYDEMTIAISDCTLLVRTTTGIVKTGDDVFISIPSNAVWFI